MGQLLSQPITEKNITLVQHDHISHSIGEMQGYRLNMEDAYCDLNDSITVSISSSLYSKKQISDSVSSLDSNSGMTTQAVHKIADHNLIHHIHLPGSNNNTNSQTNTNNSISGINNNINNGKDYTFKINIYGVFDGHGGTSTSRYVSEHIPTVLRRKLNNYINKKLSDEDKSRLIEALKHSSSEDDGTILQLINFPSILKDSFMKVDSMFYHSPNNNSGSTGVLVLVFNNFVFVANTGDSRCILSSSTGATKNLSFDHKPKNLGELMRIHTDGGYVASNRVNSILALSRAFGDFNFKMHNNNNNAEFRMAQSQSTLLTKKLNLKLTPPEEYQVTVEPDIVIHKINSKDEFLVIACDGIWDCYKSQDLVAVIRHELSLGKKLPEINELILDNCIGMANTITGIGFDNMTLIIVALHDNLEGGLNEWYSNIKNKILDEKFGKFGH